FILIAFRAIKSIEVERFFRQPPAGLPLLIVLVAIAIGYACASFLLIFSRPYQLFWGHCKGD
ncbi:DUF1146 domain-containing protein, partial [Limosilactobacillus fermentum]